MKKRFGLLNSFILMMAVFLSACGQKEASSSGTSNQSQSQAQTPAPKRLRLPDFRSSPFGLRYGFGYIFHHRRLMIINWKFI